MDIIIGFGIIMGFWAAGECLSVLMAHFVPGSVVGMLLMFFALLMKWVKAERIEKVAHFLTGNMTIFFIPAVMGIMDQWGVIRMNWLGWLAVIVLTTICVMAATGYTVQGISHLKKGGRK
ncbi:MAG: CidA/LrgA family protein [Bacteroidales bacterium]|nr:CidA/LrgA family protein [Bacteroidales bacterium]